MGILDMFKGKEGKDAPQETPQEVVITDSGSNTSATVETGPVENQIAEPTLATKVLDPKTNPPTPRCAICGMYEFPNEGKRLQAFAKPEAMHPCMEYGYVDSEIRARVLYFGAMNG